MLFLLFAPGGTPQSHASPAENPGVRLGPILLHDESIDQGLALLERWTGKTILRPQALPTTTITLTLKGSVTREEAVRALETLLTRNGLAITPLDGKFLKVTSLANAKSEAPELIDGSALGLPASDRVVSKGIPVEFPARQGSYPADYARGSDWVESWPTKPRRAYLTEKR